MPPPPRFAVVAASAAARVVASLRARARSSGAESRIHSSSALGDASSDTPSIATTTGCTLSSAVFHETRSSSKDAVPLRTANGSPSASNASGFSLTFSNRTTPLHRPTLTRSRGRSSTYVPSARSRSGARMASNIARAPSRREGAAARVRFESVVVRRSDDVM